MDMPNAPCTLRDRNRCSWTTVSTMAAAEEATLASLLRASAVITAVVIRSLNAVTPHLTVTQVRVMVIVAGLGTANVNAVAAGLGANASNASRSCDRLVRAGL